MQDRKWLPDTGYPDAVLHSEPFIIRKSHASTCDVSNMKCVVCLFAKASTRSPPNMVPCPLPKCLTLKANHFTPVIVFLLTTIFLLFAVASPIHLEGNVLDTRVAASLWTMQVARLSIFLNIPTMLVKP
jgi:hypothetical protein